MDQAEAYQQIKAKLSDREWRLDNLYWIQDEKGREVKFVRNEAQRDYWHNLWYRNVIVKGRQLGFSTFIALLQLDSCLFDSNTSAGLVDLTIPDASKKIAKVKFAYERLPQWLRDLKPLTKDNQKELKFANGSGITASLSHRGGTLQVLHVSEMGEIAADKPARAEEIITGGFGAVHPGSFIHVESTAKGRAGEFYKMVQTARAMQEEGQKLTLLDFKLHFFPWWKHPGYRIDPVGVTISAEMLEYFNELRGKYGIVIADDQRAWYVKQRNLMGPDKVRNQYPAILDEAFHATIEGAYFQREMSKMRLEGRIGDVPHDPSKRVNTFWDLGRGTTAVWFHQTDGVRHRLIDYYEDGGESLPFYVRMLQEKKEQRGFVYGKHFGPHDIEVADWGGDGKTRKAHAESLGLEFEVVPRIDDKQDAIEELRFFLNLTWIDAAHGERGIACFDNYRKQWDDHRADWRREPFEDWSCHGTDAGMTGAMGFVHDKPKTKRSGNQTREQSAWGV